MQFVPSVIDVLQDGDKMWGICIDVNVLNGVLSQAVVEYIIKDNKAIVIEPINHLDMKSTIHIIKWHFNLKCCYYKIQIKGKLKSKRYFSEDLVRVT